jgi:hypothetical protein
MCLWTNDGMIPANAEDRWSKVQKQPGLPPYISIQSRILIQCQRPRLISGFVIDGTLLWHWHWPQQLTQSISNAPEFFWCRAFDRMLYMYVEGGNRDRYGGRHYNCSRSETSRPQVKASDIYRVQLGLQWGDCGVRKTKSSDRDSHGPLTQVGLCITTLATAPKPPTRLYRS